MGVKEVSEISQLFVDMQNEISKEFKNLVTSIHNHCDDLGHTISVFQELWKQFENKDNYRENDDLLNDAMTIMDDFVDSSESIYMNYMENRVFNSSEYNDVDNFRTDEFYEGSFDFDSMNSAFEVYAEKALKQFIKGQNIEDKVFRQIAIIAITQEYKTTGIKLTLRQLYYQMVSKNYIVNSEKEYTKIIQLTGAMREACVLELDEFIDNTRFAVRYDYSDNPRDFLKNAIDETGYFISRRRGQPTYVEVWIEKEALRSVVKPITDQEDVPLFICRGYPSTSALFEQAKKILDNIRLHTDEVEDVVILYFGDHDPSGLQIPEAIQNIFNKDYQMKQVSIVPCALTFAQVRQFNLPPNPAKMTDPRAASYITAYGNESWELDAVPPTDLQTIVRDAIRRNTDNYIKQTVVQQQVTDRAKIAGAKTTVLDMWDKI